MVTAQMRGHTVYYDPESDSWFFADTHELADYERPCIKCNAMPTAEGYDACLGHIPHATSACCGHGVEEPYVVLDWRERPFEWLMWRLSVLLDNIKYWIVDFFSWCLLGIGRGLE